MTWDEWEQIKADVADRRGSSAQLNGPGGKGGAAPDLRTNSQGKCGAVKVLIDRILPGLDEVAIHADEDTDAAEREFAGWATGAGLKDAHEEWALQVNSLKARLARDQADLSKTRRDFQYVEHEVESSLRHISTPGPDPLRNA
ncbi:hypothetical protein ACIRPP_19010 [Streptomyces sp. NPDC101219]|uniref:hypothetical protein n=1 Tax=Streptomyces sp. NPDC101219 TaxID=3366131 RepID=UPI00382D4A63